jgi:hydroxymethylglutaryl-CoA lyase
MTESSSNFILLTEVGPRDGFQYEKAIIPTHVKEEIIRDLSRSGLRHIQIASFVHPEKVPQMADAELLFRHLSPAPHVEYSALTLNLRGVERAGLAGARSIEVSISASDTHSLRNAGIPSSRALIEAQDMMRMAEGFGMTVRVSIQCAFGCLTEGEISEDRLLRLAERLISFTPHSLNLSDTTGMATPPAIQSRIKALLRLTGKIPVGLHLHDTRGLGLVNVMTALECGVKRFDTSFAGMGGCPFVAGAAGNIATEDTAYLIETLGMQTGVDLNMIARCSLKMEKMLGKQFPGRIHRLINQGAVSLGPKPRV